MLKRGIEVIVGAALLVVLLAAVLPTVAQAQEEGAAPARVVVRPGDTLWSISAERLGPQATPQHIAGEVERIYALNQDRIGPDPNLIFSGQKLSLPTMGISSADEPTTKKTMAQAAKGATQGGRTVNGQTSERHVSLPNLPKMPAGSSAAAVPAIGSLAMDAPSTHSPLVSLPKTVRSAASSVVAASVGVLTEARTTAGGRWLLGWAVIALTVLVCALMAWKLPMRRCTRDEIEAWGIYASYPAGGYPAGGYHPYAEKTLDSYGGTPASVPAASVSTAPEREPATNGSKAQAIATEKGARPVGLGGIAQKRRQLTRRTSSKRPLPHNKRSRRRRSAAEALSAEARCLLREAGLRPRTALEPGSSGRIKAARRVASGGGR